MKNKILILMLAGLAYGGVKLHEYLNTNTDKIYINPVVIKYVEEWKMDMLKNDIRIARFNTLDNIIIVDDDYFDDSSRMAESQRYKNIIIITKKAVDRGEIYLKAAVYHELAHYVFGVDHVDYKSIMNRTGASEYDLIENWDRLHADYIAICKYYQYSDIF